MARLNKSQQYAILWMLSQNQTEAEIIKELKVDPNDLTKFIEKHQKASDTNNIKTTTSNTTRAKDLMIRKTSAKNNSGVSIMTKEASQVGDTFHQNMPNTNRLDSIIHRPNNG
jgi:hypothetical protein